MIRRTVAAVALALSALLAGALPAAATVSTLPSVGGTLDGIPGCC